MIIKLLVKANILSPKNYRKIKRNIYTHSLQIEKKQG
jgi:hypothetical protein